MIFSNEECQMLLQVEYRKTLERSIYSTMDALPLAFKSAMDCQLELDIARCNAMQRIASNVFYNLPDDIETLSPHPTQLPLDLYQEYMSSLDDSEMMMESAFIFYCNLGLQFFIHMTKARIYAVKMLAGQNPISYSQFLGYQKIRDMLTKSRERCELIKGDSDLPYESAELYMDVMLEECSMMFKFYLNKPIEMSDICRHVDIRRRVNKDDYNKLFLTEFSPEDRKDMLDFQAAMDERLEVLYGQILVYNELGLDNHE